MALTRQSKTSLPYIYGIDFSGARNAGKKIWIAKGSVQGETLQVEDCLRADSLPGSEKERDSCLAALRDFIKQNRNAAFGLDFPFGLPNDLVMQNSWEEFVIAFPTLYDNPAIFKESCFSAAGRRELKRITDLEAQTPFSPYNLRVYQQTYFGISGVLNPLVKSRLACVMPMQKAVKGRPLLLEICPFSTLKIYNLNTPYKGRTRKHREARQHIFEKIRETGQMTIVKPSIYEAVLKDNDGDALDSVIAALATFRAFQKDELFSRENQDRYTIEGFVFV